MQWVLLTSIPSNEAIYIDISKIIAVGKMDRATIVICGEDLHFRVYESREAVINKINKVQTMETN